ncbi:MAG: DUF5703 domain-containing protein, partial [Paludibacter sp.]
MKKLSYIAFLLWFSILVNATEPDFIWKSPSRNSSESMPCGGGDVGLNIWVENGDVLFYLSRSGAFDENNTLLKQGRFRIRFTPNPFLQSSDFKQILKLNDGYMLISSGGSSVRIFADVNKPVVHVEMLHKKALNCEVRYENWRYTDRFIRKGEGQQNSLKWVIPEGLSMKKDSVLASQNEVLFYHRNPAKTVFDTTVVHEGMGAVKAQMYNPIGNLISGGKMWGQNLIFSGTEKGTYANTDYKAWVFS